MSRKPIVRLQESFKLFVDKFNILSNNVGDPSQLNTYQDSDLVTVLNEIEAAFDASAGEILYPNGQAGETQTRLKISTNQSGGDDIDIDAGRDFLVDAVRDINLDAGGDIALDAGTGMFRLRRGSNLNHLDSVQIEYNPSGNFTVDVPNDMEIRSRDDIILDVASSGTGALKFQDDNSNVWQYSTAGGLTYQTGYKDNRISFMGYREQLVGGYSHDSVGGAITVTGNSTYDLTTGGDIGIVSTGGDISLSMPFGNTLSLKSTHPTITSKNDSVQISFESYYDHPTGSIQNGFGMETVIPGTLDLAMANDLVINTGNHDETIESSTVRWKNNDHVYLNWGIRNISSSLPQYMQATYFRPTTLNYTHNRISTVDDSSHDSVGGAISVIGNSTYDLTTAGDYTHATTGDINISGSGEYTLDVGGDVTLDVGTAYDLTTGGDFTQTTTGNTTFNTSGDFTVDAGGDIILDADGTDLIFKNGADSDQATHTLNSHSNYILTTPQHYKVDAGNDIILDADGNHFIFRNGGGNDSAQITFLDGGGFTLNTPEHLTLKAAEDITLDANGNDIIFKNGDGNDTVTHSLADNGNYTVSSPNVFTLDVVGDIVLDAGDSDIIFKRNGTTFAKWQMGIDGYPTYTRQSYPYGSLGLQVATNITIDAGHDIFLEADNGNVYLKDNGTQFGRFQNTSGNLILRSGDTTAMTFSGANVTMAGEITLPSADLDTTEKTVHGAINEVDSDLGERTNLSSFYDGHKGDIVTALNRVAARVINIYDESGNLLNP